MLLNSFIHMVFFTENVFVRALSATDTDVTAVQLVLADFDGAQLFNVDYDSKKLPVRVDWSSNTNTDLFGTFGYYAPWYHSKVRFEDVLYRASNNILPANHPNRSQRSIEDHALIYPVVCPATDVFGIAMVMLSLMLRCRISTNAVVWIKFEMIVCSSHTQCTPAHAILYHNIRTNTMFTVRRNRETV
jgi:hypothetical protein